MTTSSAPEQKETIRLTVSMPESVLKRLDDLCQATGLPKSRSRVIQELIVKDTAVEKTTPESK